MATLRVRLGDTFVTSTTLLTDSGSPLDLTGATVGLEVVDCVSGEVVDAIACNVLAPTTGVVYYTIGAPSTSALGMYTMLFKIITALSVKTVPSTGEQGLWVY